TGLIIEPGNTKELAKKLILLLKDSILREKLAANAQLFAETHLMVLNMASKIAAVYQSFL
ncbi:MAG: glycosyltransferase family 1 protein, partial [Thermoactinomyces sp.]